MLVITGTTDLDRIAEAVAHGAANWVVKGANFPELLGTVAEMTADLVKHCRGQTLQQIAEHLGRTVPAVASLLRRGLKLSPQHSQLALPLLLVLTAQLSLDFCSQVVLFRNA